MGGIIIPPVDIRNIVNKTAQFVARNGPEFEVRIQKNEANNIKFNFLKDEDHYNSYYRHRIAAFKSGQAQKEEKLKSEMDAAKAKEEDEEQKKNDGGVIQIDEMGNQIGGANQRFLGNDPPEQFEFIIKLTAQFVAKNGKSFLTELSHREAKNYHFDFLRPQHSLYSFFTAMVEQYTKILIPSRALLNKIERDAHPQHASLIDFKKDLKYRIEYTRQQRRIKQKEEEELEKDKEQYEQIDWHDFVIVETVDYEQVEANVGLDQFPNPVTVEELGKRLTQQLRYEEFGEDGIKQQLEDERLAKEAEMRRQQEMEEARKAALSRELEMEAEAERLAAMAAEQEDMDALAKIEQESAELAEKLAAMKEAEKIKQANMEKNLEEGNFEKVNLYDDDDMEEDVQDQDDQKIEFKAPIAPPPPMPPVANLYDDEDIDQEQ